MTAVIERTTVTAEYLRAVGDQGEITGYVAVWGSPVHRDDYNTWWDKNNPPDLGLKDGEFLPVRLMLEHGMESNVAKEIIGKVVDVWQDGIGIAFRAFLDKGCQFFSDILQAIREKKLKVSSASSPHLADFDDEGRFVNWYLSEISLTDSPAEPRMPAVALIRSSSGRNQLLISANEPTDQGDPIGAQASTAESGHSGATANSQDTQPVRSYEMADETTAVASDAKPTITGVELGITPDMSLQQIFEAIIAKLGFAGAQGAINDLMPQVQADVEALPETPEMMTEAGRSKAFAVAMYKRVMEAQEDPQLRAARKRIAELEAEKLTRMTAPAQPSGTVRHNGQITGVEDLRYAHLSPAELQFGHMILRSRGIQPTEDYRRAMNFRSVEALERGDKYMNDPVVRSKMPWKRANEVAISTASGGGDEWVAIAWSTAIWETARSNRIYQQLVSKGMRVEEVPQGHESIYIMTEGADPTVYTISQDADLASGRPDVNVGATRIGTGRVLLTPGELGMAVVYSDVFEEDSLIPVLSQYQYQMNEKAEETVEQLFLNGDTDPSASTNINLIDGTPGTGLSTPYYIASNGALKYALVTGTSTSRDGSALDENDYRLTMKLLPSAVRTRRDNLAFVIDPDTHNTSLNVTAIKTDDVRHTAATVTSGVLTKIYGVDVYESGFMALANNVGKIPNAGGTLGRILCVYAPFWAAGWKRKVTLETDRDILSGDNIIVAKMRLGFVPRGAGASTVSYNLTIA